MNFINSYKRLEQLCNDMFDDKHGISIYIDKLSKIDDKNIDLKKLKHCRYLRNKIVHEPNCTEENMCKPEDVKFLNDFYKRIKNHTDPLSQSNKKKPYKLLFIILIILIIILCLMKNI